MTPTKIDALLLARWFGMATEMVCVGASVDEVKAALTWQMRIDEAEHDLVNAAPVITRLASDPDARAEFSAHLLAKLS